MGKPMPTLSQPLLHFKGCASLTQSQVSMSSEGEWGQESGRPCSAYCWVAVILGRPVSLFEPQILSLSQKLD